MKLLEQAESYAEPPSLLLALLATVVDAPTFPDRVLGAWAGHRIAFIGDYAEEGDIPSCPQAHTFYGAGDALAWDEVLTEVFVVDPDEDRWV